MADENEPQKSEEPSPEDKARQEAAARREKILAKAGNRLDLVTGVGGRDNADPAADGSNDTASPAADGGGSKSAKLAAMRRRRFKKGSATKKEEETAAKPPESTTASADPAATATNDTSAAAEIVGATPELKKEETKSEPKQKEEPKAPPKTDTPPTTKSEKAPKSEAPSPASDKVEAEPAEKLDGAVPAADETSADNKAEADEAAPKKKYMGVAKMRRKMIKERQAKEEEEAANNVADTTAAAASSSVTSATKKVQKKIATLPIVMHIVTVVLLFLAGLDVGLQQGRIAYTSEDLTVHAELAPQQGLRLVDMATGAASQLSPPKASSTATLDKVVDDAKVYEAAAEMEDDEFKEFAQQDQQKQQEENDNIDPLFQVDLDKLTQGPGVFMTIGRFAVACHRVNLAIFYYYPLKLINRVQNTLVSLIDSPPMLCLVALAVRQAIGKLILGARLPEIVQDEKEGKDIMSMVKNFVKNFALKAFPTLASLYDAYVHLRADMYIILCGLFVGIAWHHQFGSSTSSTPALESSGEAGELPIAQEPPPDSSVMEEL